MEIATAIVVVFRSLESSNLALLSRLHSNHVPCTFIHTTLDARPLAALQRAATHNDTRRPTA